VLRGLLSARNGATHDQEHLEDLRVELERALVLDPGRLSPSVVTMHAAVRVRDLESGHRHELTLVNPSEANVSAGRISVLAPLGTALLGYREGDVVERVMPGGPRRLLIEEVRQQPATRGADAAATAGATSVH
jgi:regulator of nucleoside diphosphate kinase